MKHLNTFILVTIGLVVQLQATAQQRATRGSITNKYALKYAKLPDATSSNMRNEIESRAAIPLGISGNLFTVGSNETDPLSFDPSTNVMAFTHRITNSTTGVGNLGCDYSTDGGNTWTNNLLASTQWCGNNCASLPGFQNGSRYPSGIVVGNNIAMVSTALTTRPGNWGGMFRMNATSSGSITDQQYYLGPDTSNYINNGMDRNNGNVFFATSNFNNSGTRNFNKLRVWKGAPQAGNTWNYSYQEFNTLPYNNISGTSTYNTVFGWDVTFVPNSSIGYAIVVGSATDDPNPSAKPIVWKTIDGGNNWSKLPYHNFDSDTTTYPYLFAVNQNNNLVRPFFADVDFAADAEGNLHAFGSVSSHSTTDTDSIGFTWTPNLGGNEVDNGLYHFIMSPNGVWSTGTVIPDAEFLSKPFTLNGAGGANLDNEHRPQITRSADGYVMIFSWNESPNAIASSSLNDAPDLFAVSYTNGGYSTPQNFTVGTDEEGMMNWQSVSDYTRTPASGETTAWLPVVYTEYGVQSTDPCSFFFVNSIQVPFQPYVVGINTIELSNKIEIAPNPASEQFAVKINEYNAKNGIVEVISVLGNRLLSQSIQQGNAIINIKDIPSGNYVVRVTLDGISASKKLVIIR